MEYYQLIVGLLLLLALLDLIVGVSNDAVNFLNSAIGSKVAKPRTILIVASVGIFLGAGFSGGMMEVARSGIFNPSQFMFSEVMVIFLAVMLTDILLLDAFNTLGLPTSTTVSIVFELLGAAVAVAVVKMMGNPDAPQMLSTYINQGKVTEIISGIFLSVLLAFSIGALVQYVARALFTFEYKRHLHGIGVLWSGIALASITYFLFIKGLKDSKLLPHGILSWVADSPMLLLFGSMGVFTVLSYILQKLGVPMLRLVVLAGTFSLAMAFAGNDLVNFIGVPLAGYEAFKSWSGSGVPALSFPMDSLAGKTAAQPLILYLAGLVMVLTLWTSKKAKTVTETEVNLGRQAEGSERFQSNILSRSIVRTITASSKVTSSMLPATWKQYLEGRFRQNKAAEQLKAADLPSFDLVRASVNLTVASVLIALATSYKLPLSTTYVTFMVAMGSSLSDRAWGRDSAVYRVAGVLQVVGGWFVTALVAFVVAAGIALLVARFEGTAVISLLGLAIFGLVASFRYHKRTEKRKERTAALDDSLSELSAQELIKQVRLQTAEALVEVAAIYSLAIDGLSHEDPQRLTQAKRGVKQLSVARSSLRETTYNAIRKVREKHAEGSRALLLNTDLEKDLIDSCAQVVQLTRKHVNDVLLPLYPEQLEAVLEIQKRLSAFLKECANTIQHSGYDQKKVLNEKKRALLNRLEELLTQQAAGIQDRRYSAKNSGLFFNLLLESKDIIAVSFRLVKLHHRLQKSLDSGSSALFIAQEELPAEG